MVGCSVCAGSCGSAERLAAAVLPTCILVASTSCACFWLWLCHHQAAVAAPTTKSPAVAQKIPALRRGWGAVDSFWRAAAKALSSAKVAGACGACWRIEGSNASTGWASIFNCRQMLLAKARVKAKSGKLCQSSFSRASIFLTGTFKTPAKLARCICAASRAWRNNCPALGVGAASTGGKVDCAALSKSGSGICESCIKTPLYPRLPLLANRGNGCAVDWPVAPWPSHCSRRVQCGCPTRARLH